MAEPPVRVKPAAGARQHLRRTMPLKRERGITLVDNELVFTAATGRQLSGSTCAFPRRTIRLATGVPERVQVEILGHSTLAIAKVAEAVNRERCSRLSARSALRDAR